MTIEKRRKDNWLKLDIQHFADPADPVDPVDPVDPPPGDVTLSQADLDKKIEAEADRKLASALEKKQAEWDSQLAQKIKDAKSETERLASLSEKDRKDEQLSQREKDIATRLEDLERKELKADAITDLTTKKLPASFADFLLGADPEKTLANINEFKTAFDAAVEEATKGALRQDTPPAGGTASKPTNTIAELRNKQEQQKSKAPDLWA